MVRIESPPVAESETRERPLVVPSRTIGELLRAYLGQAGMSQAAFARVLHIHPAQVNKWITGVMKPSPPNVLRIATYFEVDPQPLLRIAGYLPERYLEEDLALDLPPLQMDGQRANELVSYNRVLDRVPRVYWEDLRSAVESFERVFIRLDERGSAQRSVASGQQ